MRHEIVGRINCRNRQDGECHPQNSIDDTALKKRQDDGRTFDIKMYSTTALLGL